MIFTLSPNCFAASSNIGCIILQGPHQVAKKSTNIGWLPAINSLKDLGFVFISFEFVDGFTHVKYSSFRQSFPDNAAPGCRSIPTRTMHHHRLVVWDLSGPLP